MHISHPFSMSSALRQSFSDTQNAPHSAIPTRWQSAAVNPASESFAPDGDLAKALGIGGFGANMNTGTVIDTSGVDELQQNGGRYLKDADPRK